MSVVDPIFHIVTRSAWVEAVDAGEYRPPSLESDGFVHFSYAGQVAGTANRFYREVEDLVVVEFVPTQLGADVIVEDSYGTGAEFPHVYSAIPTAAAVAIHALDRDENGDYVFSAGSASAAASPDR